jgi:bud site selection protein 20
MGSATCGKRKGGRKGHRAKNKSYKRSYKLKHYGKDHDVIHKELKKKDEDEKKCIAPKPLPFDEDLPGGGQFYALATNRYFINEKALKAHLKTKEYKRTLKRMKTQPFTQDESEAAAGRSKEAYVPVDRSNLGGIERRSDTMETER